MMAAADAKKPRADAGNMVRRKRNNSGEIHDALLSSPHVGSTVVSTVAIPALGKSQNHTLHFPAAASSLIAVHTELKRVSGMEEARAALSKERVLIFKEQILAEKAQSELEAAEKFMDTEAKLLRKEEFAFQQGNREAANQIIKREKVVERKNKQAVRKVRKRTQSMEGLVQEEDAVNSEWNRMELQKSLLPEGKALASKHQELSQRELNHRGEIAELGARAAAAELHSQELATKKKSLMRRLHA